MIDLKAAKILDQQDPLNSFRNCFYHVEGEIYLDGNSLGKLPKNVPEQLDNVKKTSGVNNLFVVGMKIGWNFQSAYQKIWFATKCRV